jgi:DNA-binding NarL/FixJ family response regulator
MVAAPLTNIIICDDHQISLLGVESLLHKIFGDHLHIRHASTGEEAIELFRLKSPELMIVDLGLPKMSGLEVVKNIRAENTKVKIIVFSGSDDPYLFQQVVGQKVNAVLRKLNTVQNLCDAIKSIESNSQKIFIDPSIDSLIKNSIDLPITNREYEVLELMAQGFTSQEIADKLNCSLPTIKTYRMRVMNKSGARNSSELLAWFLTKGNIKRNPSPET